MHKACGTGWQKKKETEGICICCLLNDQFELGEEQKKKQQKKAILQTEKQKKQAERHWDGNCRKTWWSLCPTMQSEIRDRRWCSFIGTDCSQSLKPQASYADPPEPTPRKTVQPPLNTGVIGEKKNETFIWQVLSKREGGCWELLKGLECQTWFQRDRLAVRARMRQAEIFNKMQFITWWLPPPICTMRSW